MTKAFERPVFVVGSPRSGTTLMRGVMDAHPNIMCPPCETFLFAYSAWIFKGSVWDNHYARLPIGREGVTEWFRNAVVDLFRRLEPVSGKSRFCEKTPGHVLYMDLIDEVFPDAQFIHMIRNGEDVVRSLQNVPWAPAGLRGAVRNSRTWVRSVRAGKNSGARIGPARYMELRYEDLVRQPRESLVRVCDFLEEPFSEQMLEFHKPENGSWGLELPPFPPPESLSRRKHRLSPLEHLLFRRETGRLMRELGYL